ncbi:MAG TPA: hypothetical protein DEQ84_00445 [Prevotellaceae bacterium]|nr:hypothetical protein [Prevotellaceae bacterium]
MIATAFLNKKHTNATIHCEFINYLFNMAEIKRVSKVSLTETLLSFEVGDSLNLMRTDFGVSNTQSLRTLINMDKRIGKIPKEWKFQITPFDNPTRLFVLRTK